MDSKITLSFDETVIRKAKSFAKENNMSLSRLTEFLYRQITSKTYNKLEDLPISDWVHQVAEGEAINQPKARKSHKEEYFNSKK